MRPLPPEAVVRRFRDAVARRMGLFFDDTKLGFLSGVLHRRLEAAASTPEAYLAALDDGAGETRVLAAELTVGETYFFRHLDQFRAFREVALPERLRARAATRRLSVLSAGCASGEEAYSLAIVLRDLAGDPTWTVSVRGFDLNESLLERAARGCYSPWSLRETPADVQERWFKPEGRELCLDPAIRGMVVFEVRNLATEEPPAWMPEAYDVVFLRNVLMYFTPDAAAALVRRVTRALAPGGYLFLGHAETLRGLSQDFRLAHSHETFYYQRKDAVWQSVAPPEADPERAHAAAVVTDGSWVEAIQRTTERVRILTEPSPAANAPATRAQRQDLGPALDLLRRERFGEALTLVRSLPAGEAGDPDALLLQAALLTQSGAVEEAEGVCTALLRIDELSAPAHYLMALCCEARRDEAGAREHDLSAAYLDPGFAMPRLHLGLMAARAGDRDGARRELAEALGLLQREDASRILLFGGGFPRQALADLCAAELQRCGGRP
jgi:chemotaxis protein methyltransferase CheR